jgi:GxxExxY protein
MNKPTVNKKDLLFPDLSYQIVGCAYDVFNKLGPGHSEKIYQNALAEAFRHASIKFKEQVYFKVTYNDKIVGRGYCDFKVDDKVIVELKKNDSFSKSHIDQVNQYLRSSNLQLAIILNFTTGGVKQKRIINTLTGNSDIRNDS